MFWKAETPESLVSGRVNAAQGVEYAGN